MTRLAEFAMVAVVASAAVAQQNEIKCGAGNLCPQDSPCCSRMCATLLVARSSTNSDGGIEYGVCGVGAYCLGGCDPLHSHSLDSCVPAPACNSKDYQLNSLDGITSREDYLGDASKSNWVSSGTPKVFQNQVLLTLSENGTSGSGTLLASTSYVWYGKVSAQLKSSRGAGVVSAFILLSDVKDEIDFEFVGADLESTQSNFYYQGITNCEVSAIWAIKRFIDFSR